MDMKHYRDNVLCFILVLIASMNAISHVYVDGSSVIEKSMLGPIPRGTVKSIKVPEDGDVLDCVLVHKQPAFDHLQVKKVYHELKKDVQYPEIYQNWHKYGECPKETVPIRRTRNGDIHRKHSVVEFAKAVTLGVGVYQGSFANISLWNPKVEAGEFSSARISVEAGDSYLGTLTALEAGWIVYSEKYHDSQTRLFIHWTSDNFRETGCFDLDCPGFVQLDNKFAIGVPIKPTSANNGSIFESNFGIYKSPETGNWNFKFQGVLLGYWPSSIVPLLRDHAENIEWGGEVLNNATHNHHTTTQMGNGHFSSESNRMAASIRDLQVLNKEYILEPPSNLHIGTWTEACYNITIGKEDNVIYFGGPGYSPQCNFTLT